MEPLVGTTAGKVRGFEDEGVLAFLGIPYAAPPFGEHRLLPPVAPEPWDGVRDALAYGPTSQQPDDEIVGGIPEPSIAGEDILTVNVWTPDLGASRLPVLVWIHGGGFYAGSPASPWYRGTRFARDGVVVVTVGYRLGAEGFLLVDGAPPNRAVLDWMAALDWVQENIAGFGGDPDNITIAGQSAGAAACTTLLSMPWAAGMFRRVISMSGVAMAVSAEEARETAVAISERLGGVDPTRAALAELPPAALQKAQRELLRSDTENGGSALSPTRFAPMIDGGLVPDKPLKSIAAGIGADVDVLAGATLDEATAGVVRRARHLDEAGVLAQLDSLGFPAQAYRQFHFNLKPQEVLGRAVTDRMFRTRVQALAEARAAAAGARAETGRTFTYEFRWHPPRGQMQVNLGAVHCIDIPFAFDCLDAQDVAGLAGPEPPQALADLVHACWVGFIVDGDPGWPAHDLAERQTMLFDTESGAEADPLAAERALWSR